MFFYYIALFNINILFKTILIRIFIKWKNRNNPDFEVVKYAEHYLNSKIKKKNNEYNIKKENIDTSNNVLNKSSGNNWASVFIYKYKL